MCVVPLTERTVTGPSYRSSTYDGGSTGYVKGPDSHVVRTTGPSHSIVRAHSPHSCHASPKLSSRIVHSPFQSAWVRRMSQTRTSSACPLGGAPPKMAGTSRLSNVDASTSPLADRTVSHSTPHGDVDARRGKSTRPDRAMRTKYPSDDLSPTSTTTVDVGRPRKKNHCRSVRETE